MPENGFLIILLILFIVIVIDLYTYKGLSLLLNNISSALLRKSLKWAYWVWSIGALIVMIFVFLRFSELSDHIRNSKSYFIPFTAIAIMLINILPKLWFAVFHLLEDLSWLGYSKVKKVTEVEEQSSELIDRFTFLSRIGLAFAGIQFGLLLYGVTKGRFDFKVFKENLEFENLPTAFDGLKIVQISDLHIGSFYDNYDVVAEAIDLINGLNPDIIVVTGDLVNNYAWELDGWEGLLKQLKAKMGIYSILGNHDYGDYTDWKTEEEKTKNLIELEKRQAKIGFQLLKNQSIRLEKGESFIDLIGVENWGVSTFVNYGNLAEAMKNTSESSFKILLSHDPSHWEEQVQGKTDINLTLSGHTHGMQFGIEIPGIKWSPAQYLYKYWAGLYNVNNQFLYVNRGFGYTIFPGRAGIKPEITIINLHRKW